MAPLVLMPPARIPEPLIDEAVELYLSGLSLRAVAARTHMGTMTVQRALVERGIPRRGSDHASFDETVRLYRAGIPITEIARRVGITHGAVNYRLRMAGEPMRRRDRRRERPVHQPHLGRLPADPLLPLVDRLEAELGDAERAAAALGISARSVTDWRAGRTANVTTIDRVLTHAGLLWFDVFDPEDPAARRAFAGE